MIKIAPSILAANFLHLEKEISKIEKSGADIIHLDVMDGHFVPNLTFGLLIIKQISKVTKLPLDVHLMVTNPQNYFNNLAEIGVNYISFHQETEFHIHKRISELKKLGVKAGIALNPATPVNTIFPVLDELDFVLLMSVNPGFGGQKFLPLVKSKIKELAQIRRKNNLNFEIEIDGGITNNISKEMIELGTDILVAGSYIFKSDNYKDQIDALKKEV
ncbi:MAG: ribulose-phosphate 3-epimerase [Candidatus Cloacimonetes bacterium]|nr:ribulose-phosphate 3-epimerase [Candidatus Cloacimonadota bacterium]